MEEILIEIAVVFYLTDPLKDPVRLFRSFFEKNKLSFKEPILVNTNINQEDARYLNFRRVQLTSIDEVIEVFASKMQVEISVKGEGRQTLDKKNTLAKEWTNLLSGFLIENNLTIKRIGVVGSFFFEIAKPEEKIANLINKSLKEAHSKKGNLVEAEVRYMTIETIETLDGLKMNNGTQIRTTNVQLTGEDKEIVGILVMRDLNTPPEENNAEKLNVPGSAKIFLEAAESRFELINLSKLL